MDNLSKPELLTLLSIMEGELEARDLVIEALRVSDFLPDTPCIPVYTHLLTMSNSFRPLALKMLDPYFM